MGYLVCWFLGDSFGPDHDRLKTFEAPASIKCAAPGRGPVKAGEVACGARWVARLLLTNLLISGAVCAQAPPPKPKPKSNAATRAAGSGTSSRASFVVTADAACTLIVNGTVFRSVEAGEAVRVPIPELGEQLLEAKTADGIRWSRTLLVDRPGQRIVRMALKDVLVQASLMWARRDNGWNVNWDQATSYCASLSLAGFHDWRLPTIEELETLYDPSASSRYKVVAGIALSSCCPWSSSEASPSKVWSFGFAPGRRGSAFLDDSVNQRALCVRSLGD